ncbi:alpha/beta fold hydrolase [Rubrobacter marinus]|uniref:alpha/beta fold hydrolase n=1 Tax=Rubrobacter marinus TaxID=2653852 RepID=UPI001408CA24|nr:alpha/beta fold hydrolase [Rubrobacter marinus]
MKTDREDRRRRLVEKEDVRTLTVRVFPDRDDGATFPLAYTDSGADGERPVLVVLPGGPGFASVAPYAPIRPRIVRAGFRVVMVEHRGVGLSRHDERGRDLPVEAMRVEHAARDVVAVLDHLGVGEAWVHGTSYGGYLAQAIGVLAPERVAGMFLDSTMFSSAHEEAVRERNRRLFLRGEDERTAGIAERVRRLISSGEVSDGELAEVVPPVYELAGPRVAELLLDRLADGRRFEWDRILAQFRKELESGANFPLVFEFDLAGAIWYRELVPRIADGEPFDTARIFAEKAGAFPPFEGEPFEPAAVLPGFSWPVVLFSGGRDTRAPVFLHDEMASLLPGAVHVVFPDAAHDLLRFRTGAVLDVEAAAVRAGLEEAGRVAASRVTDGPWHPQALLARALEGYFVLARLADRPAVRRGAVALAGGLTAVFLGRVLARRARK